MVKIHLNQFISIYIYLRCLFASGGVGKSVWSVVTLSFRTLVYIYPFKIHFHHSSCGISEIYK